MNLNFSKQFTGAQHERTRNAEKPRDNSLVVSVLTTSQGKTPARATGSRHRSGGTRHHRQRRARRLCQVSKMRNNPARQQQARRGQRCRWPSKLDRALGLKPPRRNLPPSGWNGTAPAMGDATSPSRSPGDVAGSQGRRDEGIWGPPAPRPLTELVERGGKEGRGEGWSLSAAPGSQVPLQPSRHERPQPCREPPPPQRPSPCETHTHTQCPSPSEGPPSQCPQPLRTPPRCPQPWGSLPPPRPPRTVPQGRPSRARRRLRGLAPDWTTPANSPGPTGSPRGGW